MCNEKCITSNNLRLTREEEQCAENCVIKFFKVQGVINNIMMESQSKMMMNQPTQTPTIQNAIKIPKTSDTQTSEEEEEHISEEEFAKLGQPDDDDDV